MSRPAVRRGSALSVLVFGGAKTLGELAAAEQVKPPTMSASSLNLASQPADRNHPRSRGRAHAHPRHRQGTRLLQKGRELRIAYLARPTSRPSILKNWPSRARVEILKKVLDIGVDFHLK
jgi:hypothetical protein